MKNKTVVRRHIIIPEEVHIKILKHSEENNLNYSKSITELLNNGLEKTDLEKDIIFIKNKANFVASKIAYNQKILEQIFSDLNIELNTNPDTNIHLKKFGKQFEKGKIND